jgi:hypothetical protein
MDAQPIRPSRWWYGAAAVVLVAGAAICIALIFRIVTQMEKGVQRVIVPGQGELALQEPGSYEIYYEYRTTVGDRVFMTGEELPELECHLVAKGTNAKVALAAASASTSYELGSHAGKSLFGFDIRRPGTYILSAAYPRGRLGPDIVLAVGRETAGGVLAGIFGSLAALFGSFVTALIIVIVTALKRSKAKQSSPVAPSEPSGAGNSA